MLNAFSVPNGAGAQLFVMLSVVLAFLSLDIQTQLSSVEFIQGAKHAMEATMMAMYSREFADYVAREVEAPGPLPPDFGDAKLFIDRLRR
ncbi:hypothetical protein PHMEG_00026230 [Phytophthora megakarya]|uniref:Uncharacterized protein n=1 Tax=Phytophthora megakarya TaxID=4795 RepID=A0A225VA37_9STRA|nr:hypothetical protein PHMEG_00026230 [Phytophthora megakarya]